MDLLPTPIRPCAQIPLLEGSRLEFTKAFQASASAWALTALFPDFVRELKTVPTIRDIKLVDTARLLGHVGGISNAGDLGDILHTIPRDVLESLVFGTIAFESSRAKNRVVGLSDDGPGVYVLGLSIDLEIYMFGYRCSASRSTRQKQSDKAQKAARLVARVDSQYGSSVTAGKPRFICDDDNLEAAEHLLASLRARYNALCALDPTHTVRMVQSPQYVGCGKHVRSRIAQYELAHHRTALTRVNKFFGLTVSLLEYRGLTPKVHIITAVRTWMSRQLPKAEMLVAALAGAYVTQGGFNLREAGGNGDNLPPGSWWAQEEFVFAEVQRLVANMAWSTEDIDNVNKLGQLEDRLQSLEDGDTRRHAERCLAEFEVVNARTKVLEQQADEVDRTSVEQAEYSTALDSDVQLLVQADQLLDQLFEIASRLE